MYSILRSKLYFMANSAGAVVGSAVVPRIRRISPRTLVLAALGVLAAVAVLLAANELTYSRLQARYFSQLSSQLRYEVGPGESPKTRFPGDGPYDLRYGYARLPEVIPALTGAGFVVDGQARVSDLFAELVNKGISPIYRAKDQAGLTIWDRRGHVLFRNIYPERVYPSFEAMPPLVWQTLLFVENRGLLDSTVATKNPAVNWRRLLYATLNLGGSRLGREGNVPGASTLATQLEKFRHAAGGRTGTPRDKLLQMLSASYRAYLDGPETIAARRRIVTSYVNSMPLAGIVGHGEVTGLGDGLWAWFGADFEEVNSRLEAAEREQYPESEALERQGAAYRQVLTLLLAVQRPSYYLADSAGRAVLERRADRYLDLLNRDGIISAQLREAARAPSALRRAAPVQPPPAFVERKAANAVRLELLKLGRVEALHSLDRFDAEVASTIDATAQSEVTALLRRLQDPAFVREQGLSAFRLLDRGDPAKVNYAFALYEKTPRGNVVRVQADNVDGPFSLVEGAKLELGSSAKLRTVVTYLEVIERLYGEVTDTVAADTTIAHAADRLTLWVRSYLAARPNTTLEQVLDAAMDRTYSSDPSERFYTGGGLHKFNNFESSYDRQVVSVREAFRHSINLPFIRIMRDIVGFQMERLPGHPAGILSDRTDPRRHEYLSRFADKEGRQFLAQFLRKHSWETRDDALAALMSGRVLSLSRLSWAFRSVLPDATLAEFASFIGANSNDVGLSAARVKELYERSDPTRVSLVDRGYLAGIHPLELWLVEYRLRNPGVARDQVIDASRNIRQEVYGWLFATPRTSAQDQRIRSILEAEAFVQIHASWRRLGYPFESLVPSYATAIGSSADRPDQLAELVGILLNDGVRRPAYRVEHIKFAMGTPYETHMRRPVPTGERVLSPEIAKVVREAMVDVVEEGTARRALGAVRSEAGAPLVIGAKTGTGNNRYRAFGRGGQLIEDRALNRTSTLVFFIGDRFYGTLTAFVSGREADAYGFTSSLPSQVLRMLGPTLSALAAVSSSDAGSAASASAR